MKKFKKIFVEITNCCNLSCSFCQRSQRTPAFITPAAFEATLERINDWTDHLALHLLGEPLLHPELPQLLAICQQHQLRVNLTTNATLLANNRSTLLASPALRQINLSLHSWEAGERAAGLDSTLDFVKEAQRTTPLFLCLRLWNLPDKGENEGNQPILRRLEEFFALPVPLPKRLTPG
ncbi:MAG: radical SAM protein, partial [Desulfuromonadales bacterium]|nr:radical SAM protein [Desulfuromonadales bacterium]